MTEIEMKLVKPDDLKILYPKHEMPEDARVVGAVHYDGGEVLAVIYLYNAEWLVHVRVKDGGGKDRYELRAFVSQGLKSEADAWAYARDRAMRMLAAKWALEKVGLKLHANIHPWRLASGKMMTESLQQFASLASQEYAEFNDLDVILCVRQGTEPYADLGVVIVKPKGVPAADSLHYGPVMLDGQLADRLYGMIVEIEQTKRGL